MLCVYCDREAVSARKLPICSEHWAEAEAAKIDLATLELAIELRKLKDQARIEGECCCVWYREGDRWADAACPVHHESAEEVRRINSKIVDDLWKRAEDLLR